MIQKSLLLGQISLTDIGVIIIIVGIVFVIVGMIMSMFDNAQEIDDTESKIEGKAIILIGPIPIILGWGKKSYILSIIGIIILILYWLFFFG